MIKTEGKVTLRNIKRGVPGINKKWLETVFGGV